MTVGATRGFEAGVSGPQTVSQLSRPRLSKAFIGTPAAGRETLCIRQHFESVPSSPEMLFAPQRDVSLHGGAEGIHVTVGVFERQDVVALGKRAEICVVLKKPRSHITIEGVAAALIGEKQIFGQRIGFVPGIGRILMRARTLFLPGQS